MKKLLLIKAKTSVPIYEADVSLLVARDAASAKAAVNSWAKDETYIEDFLGAMCGWKEGNFFVAYRTDALAHRIVAHEIFHCTHAILERTGDKFSSKHHEPYAYLNGYITDWVYAQFKKARIKIK